MSTVAQLMDRLYRDVLIAPDDQSISVRLSATIDADDTAATFVVADLLPEDLELMGYGTLVEIDQEQVRLTAFDVASGAATVIRAQNGTASDAHNGGTRCYVNPVFGRHTVFDAVADNIYALYPDLYRVATTALTTTSGYTEVPAEVMKPLDFRHYSGNTYLSYGVELLDGFTPSSTTKAIRVYGVSAHTSGHLRYRARFDRPVTESEDVQTLGVEIGWERIVIYGAAVQLLGGREMETVTSEVISEALQAQVYPESATTRKRESLYRFYNEYLTQAKRELQERHGQLVEFHEALPAVWGW